MVHRYRRPIAALSMGWAGRDAMNVSLAGQAKTAPVAWTRAAAICFTFALFGLAVLEAALILPIALSHDYTVGLDFSTYRIQADAWLDGEGFYRPRQLVGPYAITQGDSLYPPTLLLLVLPFRVLPLALWWIVPLGVIGFAIYRRRPAWWAWPLLALALAWPKTGMMLLYGNPALWGLAAIAAGAVWGWPYAFAVVKPVLAPFALLGIRHREWWVAMTCAVVLAIPFGTMWLDYARVLLNARSGDSFYLVGDLVPAVLIAVALSRRAAPPVPAEPQR